jgi:hypothetical protein
VDFWDVFWLLLVFIPLLLIWSFALVDIFRRDDLAGWAQALWTVCVILMPFIGTHIYMIFRPHVSGSALALLDDLHQRGMLSDEEYADERARLRA